MVALIIFLRFFELITAFRMSVSPIQLMIHFYKLQWMPRVSGIFLSIIATTALAEKSGVEKVEAGKFPGYVVDEVVVPVPSEIFAVLDKLGNPNWKDEVRKVKMPDTTDRMELSLVFGSVVAEGFVAVQAKDRPAVEDIGHDVINLSTRLGLGKSVTRHAQSILDAVKKEDWKAVRKELDQTQATVRAEMDRMRDGDLAQCVSLGGWLRGTASVTSVVTKAYTLDRAELLNQPMLVDHFSKAVGGMSDTARNNKLVAAISKGLNKIRKDMDVADGNFPQDKVQSIQTTCEELLAMMLQNKKAGK